MPFCIKSLFLEVAFKLRMLLSCHNLRGARAVAPQPGSALAVVRAAVRSLLPVQVRPVRPCQNVRPAGGQRPAERVRHV